MKEIQVKQIDKQISSREVSASYTLPRAEMPIKGGWGYTKEDAIIIDKNDPVVPKELPFDGIGLEYEIVKDDMKILNMYPQVDDSINILLASNYLYYF
jgi:hypothetical protein